MNYRTFTQLEDILRIALNIKGRSIKDTAQMVNIKLNTLYKWNCGAMHFSPNNIEKLLIYFQEYEPVRLMYAEKIYDTWREIEKNKN